MTTEDRAVKAPLKNIALFNGLVRRVLASRNERLGCFHGFSGVGKTEAAAYACNKYRALPILCGPFTTAKSLLTNVLAELGVAKPRGPIHVLIEQAAELLARDPDRPLILDEAQFVLRQPRLADLLRELHDKSGAAILLVGEEMIPALLKNHDRVRGVVVDSVPAQYCDLEDARHLAAYYAPELRIAEPLLGEIVRVTRGNARRIKNNIEHLLEAARRDGRSEVDTAFLQPEQIITRELPTPRKAA